MIWGWTLLRAWFADGTTGTAPPAPPPLRIALLEETVPHYRLRFYHHLAATEGMVFHVYHGDAPPEGVTAPSARLPLALPKRRVRNIFWPFGQGRVMWTTGVWAILFGGYDALMVSHHVHSLTVWFWWLARRLGVGPRLLLFGHMEQRAPPVGWGEKLRHALRRWQLSGGDILLPYAPAGRDNALRLGASAHRIFVMNNTLDAAWLRQAAASPETAAWREEMARDWDLATQPVALFIGRLYADKGVDRLIDAALALRERGHSLQLLLVGDGAERSRLERQAGDRPGIRFLGSIQDEHRLAALFSLAWMVVIPDALGLAAVHALAHGRPVITARHSPRHGPEAASIQDDVNGLLVDSLDAASLADAMESLLTQPERRRCLTEGAWESGGGRTMETMVASFLRAIHQAVGR
ncbi:MAG: glycosyltransferase family 4 protein [Magnetococcales bacterium]|nr:glycosyltransferase family 4 protein [Magnetococcales bacterium]